MRSWLRSLVVTITSLYLVSLAIPGFTFSRGFKGLFITTLVLVLINRLVKPIINLLLLPINLITLGTFRWVTNVFSLYLLSLLSPDLSITGFSLNQFPFYLSPFWTLVIASCLLSLISATLRWFLR